MDFSFGWTVRPMIFDEGMLNGHRAGYRPTAAGYYLRSGVDRLSSDSADRQHWYLVGEALGTMQQAAMTYGDTNRPTRRSYDAAWASLAEQAPALKLMDKAQRSNTVGWRPIGVWSSLARYPDRHRPACVEPPARRRAQVDADHKVPRPDAARSRKTIHVRTSTSPR